MQKIILSVECYEHLNFLAHAQLEELNIGSICGGQGVCGKDRIKIPKNELRLLSPLTASERVHLSKEEIAQGFRLGCQCWPREDNSDIHVDIFVEI